MGAIVGWVNTVWGVGTWKGYTPIPNPIPPPIPIPTDPYTLTKDGRYTLSKGVQYTIKAQNAKITFLGTVNSLETSKNSHAWKRVSLDTSKMFYTTDDYIRSTGVDGNISLQIVTPIITIK